MNNNICDKMFGSVVMLLLLSVGMVSIIDYAIEESRAEAWPDDVSWSWAFGTYKA